jgi:hypothetical protein
MKGGKIVKRVPIYFISVLSLMIMLSGCNQDANSKIDLFQYKNSYVGDNSAVGNIINQLAHNKDLNQISLDTKEQPYGIILEYKEIDAENLDQEMKEVVISNATYLFTLINNVEWIIFKFPDQEFTVTKEELQGWYNTNLDEFENEEDLETLIQEHLKSEDAVNQFFHE